MLLSARLEALDRRIEEAFKTRDTALGVALEAATRRLDGMNEFRAALTDQSARMQTRTESEVLNSTIREKLEALQLELTANGARFIERREYDASLATVTAALSELRPELGTRVDDMAQKVATLVERREFDDATKALVERTESSRLGIESKFVALGVTFSDKLEQYRSARDLRTETDLAPIRATLAQQGKPNWGLFASMAALSVAMISGAWLIVGLKIDNSVSPMTLSLESTKSQTAQNTERLHGIETATSGLVQTDGTSRTDRVQLNERVKQLEAVVPPSAATAAEVGNLKSQYALITDRLIQLRTQVGKQESALVEIETQFCGADNMRNLTHAYDMRFMSMVWSKVFAGEKIPTDNAFYPTIGKCHGETTVAGR